MLVLGVASLDQDSAVALLDEKNILAAIEEEKVDRAPGVSTVQPRRSSGSSINRTLRLAILTLFHLPIRRSKRGCANPGWARNFQPAASAAPRVTFGSPLRFRNYAN